MEKNLDIFIGENEMNIVCAWCGARIGKKDGRGVSGTSHSMCKKCFESLVLPVKGEDKFLNGIKGLAALADAADLGRIMKERRLAARLTLAELAQSSAVSQSHLARIENGQRFPSARVLSKIAAPLGFEQGEILSLAGYLSDELPHQGEPGGLDPLVARALAGETFEMQRVVLVLLENIKAIAGRLTLTGSGRRG
jgi:transcriptional regulator with XRE-family HTH domain